MILDHFIAGFKVRFPERAISIHESDAAAIIAGANPNIGNIEVQDGTYEIIVLIGDITHCHFDCHEYTWTEEEKQKKIAHDVLDFLNDVFADKVEFYRIEHGGGGWRPTGNGTDVSFTWSGGGGFSTGHGAANGERQTMDKNDQVNHPKHYTSHPSGVECIQITEHMGFNLGNAVKYLWRADLKDDAIEDLKKAKWYIERELLKRGA